MRKALLALLLLVGAFAPAFASNTWFVRPDGGTRYSSNVTTGTCDGLADVADPGTGALPRHCAYNDVRFLVMDTSYGNYAPVFAGGDTLVLRGCKPGQYQQNPVQGQCRIGHDNAQGANGGNGYQYGDFFCQGTYACNITSVPSGPDSAHPTRILGGCAYDGNCKPVVGYPYLGGNLTTLFGGYGLGAVIDLSGSSNIDIEGIEITTHNGVCSAIGDVRYPRDCNKDNSNGQPIDDFAKWGIISTNTTANVKMRDIYIHGMSYLGMGGPIAGNWDLARVDLSFNAYMGWNFDDGNNNAGSQNAAHTHLDQVQVTMVGNGCKEEYPVKDTNFPADACWDSASGGFGDSWSGQGTNLEEFTCDQCLIAYNAKDGAIGPHTNITRLLSLTNSVWAGNMGQAGKWGQSNYNTGEDPALATAVIQNNLFVGNCRAMANQLPGAKQNFNMSTGLPGSRLSNFCRAAGPLFDYYGGTGTTVHFTNNTFVTYQATVFDLGCYPSGTCTNSIPYYFDNNVFLGLTSSYGTDGVAAPGSGGPGLFFLEDSAHIQSTHNVEYGIRNGDACGQNGNICADPLLASEPLTGVPPENQLFNFNFGLQSGSPARGAGVAMASRTTDFTGAAANTDAGALNYPNVFVTPVPNGTLPPNPNPSTFQKLFNGLLLSR